MGDTATPPGASVYTFTWHPTYAGQSVDAVRTDLAATIASDQRAYALALEAAEQHENSALESVIGLERKWGPFDLNWAETDPGLLADQVVRFEWERERRRELFPVSAHRAEQRGADDEARDPVSSQRLESNAARGIVVAVILLIVILVWWFFLR